MQAISSQSTPVPAPVAKPQSHLLDYPPFDVSTVGGNAPLAVKQKLGNIGPYLDELVEAPLRAMALFGREIGARFEVVEISILPKADGPRKREARVVIELDVAEDMVNSSGNVHGGCSAFLVDICSSIVMTALACTEDLERGGPGKEGINVSQAISMIYHSPAALGERLRIVNTSTTLGRRSRTGRTEIWNATHGRLVASGTHIKMSPSPPPEKAKL